MWVLVVVYVCPVNAQAPDRERIALTESLSNNLAALLEDIGGIELWNTLLTNLGGDATKPLV